MTRICFYLTRKYRRLKERDLQGYCFLQFTDKKSNSTSIRCPLVIVPFIIIYNQQSDIQGLCIAQDFSENMVTHIPAGLAANQRNLSLRVAHYDSLQETLLKFSTHFMSPPCMLRDLSSGQYTSVMEIHSVTISFLNFQQEDSVPNVLISLLPL